MGILTLLPPIIILIIAIKTKNSNSSMMIGILLCCILYYKQDFLTGLIDMLYESCMDEDQVWYILFVALFGIVLGLWAESGATRALAFKLSKYATNQKRTLILTWLVGLLLFIDDFTSIAVHGTLVKLYDEKKLPRVSLSYITDAQASPLNALIPFGTWGLYYTMIFKGFDEVVAAGYDGIGGYIKTLPYQFYSYAALIISLLFVMGVVKPFGPMKKAFDRAKETGALYGEKSAALNEEDDEEPLDETKLGLLLSVFIIPLVLFVGVTVYTGDVITASLITIAFMIVYMLVTRVANWQKLMAACMKGIIDMAEMIVIVIPIYMLYTMLDKMGLPDFVISVAEPILSPALIPFVSFVVCCLLTFFSGSNWGITLPVASIVIPFCATVGGNMPMVMASLVSGAAFGAHACFYCDVTVFSAGMARVDTLEHAQAQLPYALIGGAISAVLYLVAGLLFT